MASLSTAVLNCSSVHRKYSGGESSPCGRHAMHFLKQEQRGDIGTIERGKWGCEHRTGCALAGLPCLCGHLPKRDDGCKIPVTASLLSASFLRCSTSQYFFQVSFQNFLTFRATSKHCSVLKRLQYWKDFCPKL